MFSCLLSCMTSVSEKGSTVNKKLGGNPFFFSLDHFSEGRKKHWDRATAPESVSNPL